MRERLGSRKAWLWFVVLLALTGLFVAAVELWMGIRYEVNDDAVIANIAAGAYGSDKWRLVYVNILWGLGMKPLYALFAGVNWFAVLLVTGGAVCFALLGLLAVRRLGKGAGLAVWAVLLVYGGLDLFARFHYVRYAALFAVTGVLLLYCRPGRLDVVSGAGLLLLFLAGLLRFDMLVAVGALGVPFLLWRFLKLGRAEKRAALCMALGLVALSGGVKLLDGASYRWDEGWKRYTEFNSLRTEISDFRYQFADGEDFAALGYSGNDHAFVGDWAYWDPEVFSGQALERLAKELPGNTAGNALRDFRFYAGRMVKLGKPEYRLLAAVLLGWLLLSGKKRWLPLLGTLGVFVAELGYLSWLGRYPQRIDSALVLALTLLCMLGWGHGWAGRRARPVAAVAAALLLVAAVPVARGQVQSARDYWNSHRVMQADFDTLTAEEGPLYLIDNTLVDAANGFDVWRTRPEGYFADKLVTGGWLMASPGQQTLLDGTGYESPYRAAVELEQAWLVLGQLEDVKQAYLRAHYDPAATLVLQGEGAGVRVYTVEADG